MPLHGTFVRLPVSGSHHAPMNVHGSPLPPDALRPVASNSTYRCFTAGLPTWPPQWETGLAPVLPPPVRWCVHAAVTGLERPWHGARLLVRPTARRAPGIAWHRLMPLLRPVSLRMKQLSTGWLKPSCWSMKVLRGPPAARLIWPGRNLTAWRCPGSRSGPRHWSKFGLTGNRSTIQADEIARDIRAGAFSTRLKTLYSEPQIS